MDFWRFSRSGVDAAARLDRSYDLQLLWIGIGAATMGCGVWAMHFVGMLAYRLSVPMNYNLL